MHIGIFLLPNRRQYIIINLVYFQYPNRRIAYIYQTGIFICMNKLGEEIKQARDNLSMSQKTLAMLLGVQTQTVWRWEKGEREPSLETIKKIAALLKAPQLEASFNELGNMDQPVSLGLGYWGTVLDNMHKLAESGNTREISLVYTLLKAGCEDLAKVITPKDSDVSEKPHLDIRQNNYGRDATVNVGTTPAQTSAERG